MNEIRYWQQKLAKLLVKILENDEHILKDIDEFIWEYNRKKAHQKAVERWEYNRQKAVERDLPMTVKVLEAISQVGLENSLADGGQLFLKSVAERVISNSWRVGEIIRNSLQLKTMRWTRGENKGLYYIVWDVVRLKALCGKYGVEFREVKDE